LPNFSKLYKVKIGKDYDKLAVLYQIICFIISAEDWTPSSNQEVRMLVVLSDLHFEEEASNHIPGSGSQPALAFKRNLPAAPYRLLVEQLAVEAKRNNAQKLEFVLAGDIFDLHRSGLWFNDNENDVRPYVSSTQISPELEAFTLRLLEGIVNEDNVKDVLPVFRLLANGRYIDSRQKEQPFPVPVEVHYIPGNHDRLANASPAVRQAVRKALGLADHGAAFPNAMTFDDERALVRHGHEYDYANFSVSLHQEETIPLHLPVHYYQDPAFGDLVTVEIASQLPALFRRHYGDDAILADQTLRALYLRLLEFDDLRPLTALFNYFVYADGWTIDKEDAWDVIVPVVIDLLENIYDDPFLLYWLDRFDQPWRLDLIDAVQAVLAAKPWRWDSRFIPLDVAEKVSKIALRSTAKQPATEQYAARESSILSGRHRYVIAGHTHKPRISLIANDQQGERYYVDTGTWRNRVLATFDYRQFGRLKSLNYMVAYGPNEDRGLLPDNHLKIASFDYWSGLTQGWERDRQGIKSIDKQR
jgi:UDP-2,3-diacylglucosamine pyrophosphatase LpxH